jgi:hypothetical protein
MGNGVLLGGRSPGVRNQGPPPRAGDRGELLVSSSRGTTEDVVPSTEVAEIGQVFERPALGQRNDVINVLGRTPANSAAERQGGASTLKPTHRWADLSRLMAECLGPALEFPYSFGVRSLPPSDVFGTSLSVGKSPQASTLAGFLSVIGRPSGRGRARLFLVGGVPLSLLRVHSFWVSGALPPSVLPTGLPHPLRMRGPPLRSDSASPVRVALEPAQLWREGRNRTSCLDQCRPSPSSLRLTFSFRLSQHGPSDRDIHAAAHYPSARPRASLSRARARDSEARRDQPPLASTRTRAGRLGVETGPTGREPPGREQG